jgi:uncharacterized protein (TIGR02328 family)
MRLWHEYLIPYLDNKRLLGQHRECCALRGKGWGKKHSVVDYVFEHHIALLLQYHALVMNECSMRGFKTDIKWLDVNYRGKKCLPFTEDEINASIYIEHLSVPPTINPDYYSTKFIYPEHNPSYLRECLLNLRSKNATLNIINIDELLLELDLKGL